MLRLAPTFLRFGSFQICLPSDKYTGAEGPSSGMDDELLPKLYEYTIEHFYPEFWDKFKNDEITKEDMYQKVFEEITRRTAQTVAKWQGAGFCHGVLNTDNMSILGLTIDYGPFGFMDHFNPDHICNHSDKEGRYTYDNQPTMCKWNLFKLASAMSKYIPKATDYVDETYDILYTNYFLSEFKQKLGISKLQEGDVKFLTSMYTTLKNGGYDWTNFFRNLHLISVPESKDAASDLSDTSDVVDKLFDFRTRKELK